MPLAAHPSDAEVLAYTPPDGSTLVGGTLSVGISARRHGFDAAARVRWIFTPEYSWDTDNLLV